MKKGISAVFVHFFVVVFFIIASLAYFYPVLQGKTIRQSDIEQFTGMAREQNDFRNKTDSEPYWTNSAFGGMPTYQLGAYYPHDYVRKLDRMIRFLPRPADYLFLYFIGFYILLCCLKIDYRIALVGALAFGFSTYLIIILGVGHNAKAHAIGYLPMILAGIVLTFRKKYFWGFILTSLAMALEIGANHYQMTYYLMLLVLVLGAVYLIDAIRRKNLKHFGISVGILFLAVLLSIGANATSLMATKEYVEWSTRGASGLTIAPDGSPKEATSGLSREYITNWSYGITESLNLFVPRMFGGASSENLGEHSKTFEYVTEKDVPRSTALQYFGQLPLYWGGQPGTSGPAYIGAIIFFLFILGLFLVKGRNKWWLVAGTILSLLLSWGKNFGLLTDFMIDYFPLYDKFRAVSSIQVILEICAPVMAVLALRAMLDSSVSEVAKWKALKTSGLIILSVGVLLFLVKGMFDFSAPVDETMKLTGLEQLPEMLQADRKAVYTQDLIRSLVYVLLSAGALWLYLKGRVRQKYVIIFLGFLIVTDLVKVDLRYVNEDHFVRQRLMEQPFQAMDYDKKINEDKEIFRVYDPEEAASGGGGRTAFFHHSIWGYHAAKPAAMQALFDYHIFRNNRNVLDMLNVRYVIQQDKDGGRYATRNAEANGNAWFVEKLTEVGSADAEIMALDSMNLKLEAVVNTADFPDFEGEIFQSDTASQIRLTSYEPNRLSYSSENSFPGLAVFSEMYYPHGWNAYIDGNKTQYFRVNYALRAMQIPKGKHQIEFKFEPPLVSRGSMVTLGSSLIFGLLLLSGLGISLSRSRKYKEV